ncbi:DUF4410 domain-containing protein [Paraburkholderia sp. DHOC27]|uniref:DUF4410 domain-containing protein n=1 Tax=Paraburkholderia sp. DHOC27 TaxID=2303330 RepID=UPI000E3C64A4|nr:DUF4410 domain-containing protein [Paraburkholderia sp. DHOC27]RFU44962.1 DUF4410 domain-containing protein [Paraburkholderia sp. DHOC27]
MFTSIQTVAKKSTRAVCAAGLVVCALLAGCAGGTVTNATTYPATHLSASEAKPETIYVYAFDCDPSQVKLDNTGVVQKIESQFKPATPEQKQVEQATQVREQVANEIVRQLQSMGLPAVRADVPAPANQNVLIVQGRFDTIDSGNRRRRMLIGLGAGKSELSSTVQLFYKPAGDAPRLVQSFAASADSGKMPGMVETAGVGAAAGHLAASGAAGAGLHGASETKKGGATGDAKNLAESIAKQVAQIGKSQGWVAVEHTQG